MAAQLGRLLERVSVVFRSLAVIRASGLVRLSRPDLAVRAKKAMHTFGPLAGPIAAAAANQGPSYGLVDELGPLTFRQLDARGNALARAWLARGIGADAVIGLLTRDHRGEIDVMVAAGKLGATLLPLNTGFGPRQLAEVARREDVTVLVHDEEFAAATTELPADLPRFLAWVDDDSATGTIEGLIGETDDRPLPPPEKPGGLILLTSGTGGTPKGAPRGISQPLAVAQLLDRIPLRAKECTVIAAPLFHGTGLSQFIMSMALGSTVVVRRRFDAEATLRAVEKHRGTALILVPTMLRRLVALGGEGFDLSTLRIIMVAGAALPPELGNRAMDMFGDVLHNMYGGTEVSVATVALPEDWRAAPGTVGRPPVGCRVALLDGHGTEITRPGVTGRIFVANDLTFDGYTDGQHKEMVDGMVATGDLGHLDDGGRLFVDGREDDMIVSGGENVYPVEVEHVLVEHAGVAEAAVVGVADEEFGQRLVAYVVPADGAVLDEDQLRSHIRSNLARHKVPREFVVVDELPRNSTGKLLRRQLAEH